MTYATENPTLEILQEKYNSTKPRVHCFTGEPIRGGKTEGEWNREGVAVLGGQTSYGPAGVTKHNWKLGSKGEVRWVASDNIPPADILEMAVVDGTITWEMFERTQEQKAIETQEFLGRYQAMREKHGYSQEEKAEMRSEFGDEEVIDVFTGKEVAL